MENKEQLYNIYYGDNEGEYITRYLKDGDIIYGYLSEAKAFDLFYDNMIMCNNYISNAYNCDGLQYENLDILLDPYNEEEDYYIDEYQVFIIDPAFDEDITKKATEKMGNTLYYDNALDLYITGITDLGTSRTIIPTDLKVEEVKEVLNND